MLLPCLFFFLAVANHAAEPCDVTGSPVLEGCYRRCRWWGDPHYTTFDGKVHHFQEKGIFKHVTPCDGDFTKVPFDISADLIPWSGNPDTSRTKDVIITLYSPGGSAVVTIKMEFSAGGVTTHTDGIHYYNSGSSKFVVDGNTVSVYTDANQLLPDVVVKFPVGGYWSYEAFVELDEGYKTFVCGLCGYFNDNPHDDLQDVDCGIVDLPDKVLEYTANDWNNLAQVAKATHNKELAQEELVITDAPDLSGKTGCMRFVSNNCLAQVEPSPNYECCPQGVAEELCTNLAMDCCFGVGPGDDNCLPENLELIMEEICPCWHV